MLPYSQIGNDLVGWINYQSLVGGERKWRKVQGECDERFTGVRQAFEAALDQSEGDLKAHVQALRTDPRRAIRVVGRR